jgi:hypothetical protein
MILGPSYDWDWWKQILNPIESILTAQYSPERTVVHRLIPPATDVLRHYRSEMRFLENRRIIFQPVGSLFSSLVTPIMPHLSWN